MQQAAPVRARAGSRASLRWQIAGLLLSPLAASAALAANQSPAFPQSLKELSLQELMNVNVSTASRVAEPLFEAPVAAYVVTRDEIRRSGVRTIPEALRLAPGVEVGRENTHTWNISIRGFNGDLSNKLLVLIDGRSVYSPLFAGVFWDVQDYLLEDIDRIEVIAGPGGTMWGANAVNGVINIITRRAGESHDEFVSGGAGNGQRFAGARVATGAGDGWQARAYLKYFDRDPSQPRDGSEGFDDWSGLQGGFRTDRESEADTFTVQGDAYDGDQGASFNRDFTLGTLPGPPVKQGIDVSGSNLLGRWTRRGGPEAELSLQAYFDHTLREIPETFTERRDTVDVDFQHYFPIGARNDFIWGAGVRYTGDAIDNSLFASFVPPTRNDWTWSAFVQDRVDLDGGRSFLTLGTKLEHNDYTGFEYQPNVRLTSLISDAHMVWAAVSRAVRIPARLDADLNLTAPFSVPGVPLPIYVEVAGSDAFESEKVLAYEAGWRARVGGSVTLDLAAFYNDYEDLQTQEPLPAFVVPGPPAYLVVPNVLRNGKDAHSNGATLAATWQPASAWRLQFSYTYFDLEVQPHADSADQGALAVEGNSPEHQAMLNAYFDLPRNFSVFTGLRYVSKLPSQDVPDYTAFDANLIWRAGTHLELSVTGRNLLDDRHVEFGAATASELERAWYAQATWRY